MEWSRAVGAGVLAVLLCWLRPGRDRTVRDFLVFCAVGWGMGLLLPGLLALRLRGCGAWPVIQAPSGAGGLLGALGGGLLFRLLTGPEGGALLRRGLPLVPLLCWGAITAGRWPGLVLALAAGALLAWAERRPRLFRAGACLLAAAAALGALWSG